MATESEDYCQGGLVALDHAEVLFKAKPFFNALQQVHNQERELEQVNYQLANSRRQIAELQARILLLEDNLRSPKLKRPQRVIAKARKALQRLVVATQNPLLPPENRLRLVHDVATGALVALGQEELEEPADGPADGPETGPS